MKAEVDVPLFSEIGTSLKLLARCDSGDQDGEGKLRSGFCRQAQLGQFFRCPVASQKRAYIRKEELSRFGIRLSSGEKADGKPI